MNRRRRSSSCLSTGSNVSLYNVTSLRQNAEKILRNCEMTLQELLQQQDVSNYSIQELFVLISQQYEQRQQDLRQMGRLIIQATDLVQQQFAQRSVVLAHLEREQEEHRKDLARWNQNAEQYKMEIADIREKIQQTELELLETHEQKDTLQDLYQDTLTRRTSIANNLQSIKQIDIQEEYAKQFGVTLLELEVKQLRTELSMKEGIISQKDVCRADLYQKYKEFRNKLVDLEHQNKSLKDTITTLKNQIIELQQDIKEQKTSIQNKDRQSQKLDKYMETRITESEQENPTSPKSLKRSSSLYAILKKHESISCSSRSKVSLAIEIGYFQYDQKSPCHSDRSNGSTSEDNVKNLTGLSEITQTDGELGPESPLISKIEIQKIQEDVAPIAVIPQNKHSCFQGLMSKFQLLHNYLKNIASMRVARLRKGHFTICNRTKSC